MSESGQPLKIQRAIEVGHVFKLGTKYAEALDANFLAEDGKQHPFVMGCFGLGVTRTLQAIIECGNDKHGVIWPQAVAPWQVCLTVLDIAPEGEVMKTAQSIYDELTAAGVEVLMDDRDVRPGVKFKDSELIGIPVRVSVGERSLKESNVEFTLRAEGGRVNVPVGETVARVRAALA